MVTQNHLVSILHHSESSKVPFPRNKKLVGIFGKDGILERLYLAHRSDPKTNFKTKNSEFLRFLITNHIVSHKTKSKRNKQTNKQTCKSCSKIGQKFRKFRLCSFVIRKWIYGYIEPDKTYLPRRF